MTPKIRFSAAVETARRENSPIVALESTIITHGMPFPQNVETARLVEHDIREAGATPATIAIIKGELHVGLDDGMLTSLGQAKDVLKLSRADLAYALASGATGATTVAATMIAAHHVGIEVFATGGIGGVHKGAETTFDISADLQELAQTPVTVVAAGAKAILDLPKTFEVLETLGVPVIAFGQDVLPAFWSATSDIPAPLRADTAKEIADAMKMRKAMGLGGGQLVCNPIPTADEIKADVLEPIIAQALMDATDLNISAKGVTPYLLSRIFDLTDGQSLTANIALIRNNARLAAEIACEMNV